MSGKLYVISGPSGAGKGTICKELAKLTDFYLSISMTTRAPRGSEQNGVEYFFVTREEFEREIRDGGLLEYAETYGNYYGTPKRKMEEQLSKGRDVVLEIDVKGAAQVTWGSESFRSLTLFQPLLRPKASQVSATLPLEASCAVTV